jgi:hypothetical protein
MIDVTHSKVTLRQPIKLPREGPARRLSQRAAQ